MARVTKLEFDIQMPSIVEQHNTFFIFWHLSKTNFHSKHVPFPLHQTYTKVRISLLLLLRTQILFHL